MISVIIPTHNRKKLLEKAIESIQKQQNVEIEIIIINDASTDDTDSYIKELKYNNIRYIKNDSSLFAHGARKRGYEFASGDLVVFMDDDDFYIDDSFFKETQKIMDENPSVSVVIGSTIQLIDGQYGSIINLGTDGLVKQKDYINGFGEKYKKPLSTLTAVFRRAALDELNFRSFRMINDTCIYLLGILQGDSYLINRPVAAYRMHDGNISNSKFRISFIKDCLEAKREIYTIAKEKNVLDNPRKWFGEQLCQSAFYFISSSGKTFSVVIFIFTWLLLRSKGSQFYIIRKGISSLR